MFCCGFIVFWRWLFGCFALLFEIFLFLVKDLEAGWGRELFCEERVEWLVVFTIFDSRNKGFCCLAGCCEAMFWGMSCCYSERKSMDLGLDG